MIHEKAQRRSSIVSKSPAQRPRNAQPVTTTRRGKLVWLRESSGNNGNAVKLRGVSVEPWKKRQPEGDCITSRVHRYWDQFLHPQRRSPSGPSRSMLTGCLSSSSIPGGRVLLILWTNHGLISWGVVSAKLFPRPAPVQSATMLLSTQAISGLTCG
ncbi:hypothetical protein BDW59DRAFT_152741 [Aspergillus cavernicola]|uniref:Uncharacterized protein n=1 Tax=Aspergillus cavernicola TaxID=176166 RepID=A0ABR4HP80_9EURO